MAKMSDKHVNRAVDALREILPSGVAAVLVLVDTNDEDGGMSIVGNKLARMVSADGGELGGFAKLLRAAADSETELDGQINAGTARAWTNNADGSLVPCDAEGNPLKPAGELN